MAISPVTCPVLHYAPRGTQSIDRNSPFRSAICGRICSVPTTAQSTAAARPSVAWTACSTTSHQGPLVVNPGGPGGNGLTLAGVVASSLPAAVAAQYDVIGFDPRGVGKSTPALDCVPGYFDPVRPDPVPHSKAEEAVSVKRAASFAKAFGTKYKSLLKYIDTVSALRDIVDPRCAGREEAQLPRLLVRDLPRGGLRQALPRARTAVGAGQHRRSDGGLVRRQHRPGLRVRRPPQGVHGLGRQVRLHVSPRHRPGEDRERLVRGPREAADPPGRRRGYYNGYWPYLAAGFAAYVNSGDEAALVSLYEDFAAVDAGGDNGFSIYATVQCRDAKWPRDWKTWHRDTEKVYAKAPFLAWNNAWHNAPCAFWPTSSLKPVDVSNSKLPPVLLFQATDDAATPYSGGVTVHRLLKRSSLVVERRTPPARSCPIRSR